MVKPVIVKVASLLAAGACAAGMAGTAAAQETKIALGMSGWTGFAPLSLADKAGIFKKNGLDVELKMIPPRAFPPWWPRTGWRRKPAPGGGPSAESS